MPAHKDKISFKHPQYKHNISRWQKCRDAVEGEDAVKHAGEIYLPRLTAQTRSPSGTASYKRYLQRSSYYSASGRTVDGFKGMIFRKRAVISFPDKFENEFKNVTLTNTTIENFAKDITGEVITVGRIGIITDFNDALDRPFVRSYAPENIINWRVDVIDGISVLTRVMLAEHFTVEDPKNEFGQQEAVQFRQLKLMEVQAEEGVITKQYEQIVWTWDPIKNEFNPSAPIVPTINGVPLTEIPFTFISSSSLESDVEKAIIEGIVDKNLSHYRNSADLEHAIHLSNAPTPVINLGKDGVKPKDKMDVLQLGSESAIVISGDGASIEFLTHDGQSLEQTRNHMQDKERQMATLGARLLEMEKAGVEAAKTVELRQSGEQSVLGSLANTVSDGIIQAFGWFMDWLNEERNAFNITLNTDFNPSNLTPDELRELVAAWQTGAISSQTYVYNIKKGEMVEPDFNEDEEVARLEEVKTKTQEMLEVENAPQEMDSETAISNGSFILSGPGSDGDPHVHAVKVGAIVSEYAFSKSGNDHKHNIDPNTGELLEDSGHTHPKA